MREIIQAVKTKVQNRKNNHGNDWMICERLLITLY